jgi:ribosomal protein S27E
LDIRLKHEGKYNKELTKISILSAVENYSKKKRNEIIEKLRLQTEKSTGEYFKSSAPQASEFADLPPMGTGPVKISSSYDISAINNQGKEKSLSKGQAHVLGLSYVSGCRQITSKNHFLFIDSPLHNISGDSRNEVAKVLVDHLPDVQIVLFVTDTEYTSGDPEGAKAVREFLNPNTKVGKEWIINVTCIDCKDQILVKSKKTQDELVCKNCNKIYVKKIDSTGRRLVTEYERNV